MSETTEAKTRTITLTDAAPVRIRGDQWPEIAHGAYRWHDNKYEFQANRQIKIDLRVRQHEDGRALVYGVYDYTTAFQGEAGVTSRAGRLIEAGADLAATINQVGETLADQVDDLGRGEDTPYIHAATREAIAELPAVDL